MAHAPKTFRVDNKKKILVLYTNADECDMKAEESLRDYYLTRDYELKLEEKKKTITIEEMRKELANAPEKLEEFEAAYTEKAVKGNKDFKQTGFAKACKIYNDWKKTNKK